MSGPTNDPSDIDLLRHDFPGWTIDSMWVTSGTGPDTRRLHARKDDVTLSAWTAGDLAAQIRGQS